MDPAQENGRPAIHFAEQGHGQFSGYSGTISWTVDSVWIADGTLRPLRFEKVIKDDRGRTIGTERKRFDPAKGSVRFDREREGSAAESKQLSVPADTLAAEGMAGILGFLPYDHWHPMKMHILTNDPKLYELKLEIRGKERVTTPAGEFECYKVELVPELGALNIVRSLVPKTYFWFTVAAPHLWVKYEGTENGLGTPHITIELQKYQVK